MVGVDEYGNFHASDRGFLDKPGSYVYSTQACGSSPKYLAMVLAMFFTVDIGSHSSLASSDSYSLWSSKPSVSARRCKTSIAAGLLATVTASKSNGVANDAGMNMGSLATV